MRRYLRVGGWTLIGLGCFVLYFLVYQLVGTNAVTDRQQERMRQDLRKEWSAAPSGDKPEPKPPKRPPLGEPFGLIEIPKIGVSDVVVEGARREDLRKGPGHISSTVMPGERGTFAVSAHRTTYSAPFRRLDEVGKGDTIRIVTRTAIFTYTVTRTEIVDPSATRVLDNVRGKDGKFKSTVTLTTCHPLYSAAQRLVVFGDLTATDANQGKVAA